MYEFLRTIKRIEDEVSTTIRNHHARELATVDAALDQILRGFDDFGSRKEKPENRLEAARLLLITRSFNSLLIARETLGGGYYQQALTLVRMAMEDKLISHDIEKHPPTLIALLDGEGDLGKGNLGFGKMAERRSAKAKEVWDLHYGQLSERSAHPRAESMEGLTTIDPDGGISLRPGPHYDQIEMNYVLYFMLRETLAVMATLVKTIYEVEDDVTIGTRDSDWLIGSKPVFDEVKSLLERLDKWTADQIEEYPELS